MTTDPPCARCGHPAVCHETNYVERGPCWKCHTCAGYVVVMGYSAPFALPPIDPLAELMGPPPPVPLALREAVMRAILTWPPLEPVRTTEEPDEEPKP